MESVEEAVERKFGEGARKFLEAFNENWDWDCLKNDYEETVRWICEDINNETSL